MTYCEWGADRQTLIKLYMSLLSSKLQYSSLIYGWPDNNLNILNAIYHQGLRLGIGAFRLSLMESLCTEAYTQKLPAQLRRTKRALQYYVKIKSNPTTPAFSSNYKPQK